MGDQGDNNTWEDLVVGLGLGNHELAHRILVGKPAPNWSEQPTEFGALVTPSTNPSAKAMLLRSALSAEENYSLTVADGRVAVLHEMTEPFELRAHGGRFVAFAGDFRRVANQIISPDLVELPGVQSRTAAATAAFITQAVPVLDWDQINTELEVDGAPELVARAGAPVVAETLPPWTCI